MSTPNGAKRRAQVVLAYYAAVLLREGGRAVLAHVACNDNQRPQSWVYVGRAILTSVGQHAINCAICTNLLSDNAVNIETLQPMRASAFR